MSFSPCTILISRQAEKAVSIPRSLAGRLHLRNPKSVVIRLGSKRMSVPVKLHTRGDSSIVIPIAVANLLKLPGGGKYHAVNAGDRELRLGPLIGVLTSTGPSPMEPFGSRGPYIRELLAAASEKGYSFAFTPRNVNWEDEIVTGYFPAPGGKWVRRTVPLPDVVYNRLTSRTAEKSVTINDFKERFIRRQIPLFNWSFFDKWDVYRLLDGDDAYKYVPESYINPSTYEIRRMLEKHKFVYLKPTGGSLGIGIYRLTYNPMKGYFARFRRGSSNVLIRFQRFEGLMQLLRNHKVNLNRYVVQQGIRLIEIENCPIDFRFHLNKNGRNVWVVAGIGAKKAGKGSVTTHIRTGGQLLTPEQVLRQIYGNRADEMLEQTKEVAVTLAEAIEHNYNRPLGELGFDLGIDQNENVWMFEANAKPGRSIFKHPLLKEQGRASLRSIFEHCMYLSRFRTRREG